MLLHDQFVFLLTPKTGCTFLADVLKKEFAADDPQLGKHSGWAMIPSVARQLPVLAYVRNPWDWYVSWYHFNSLNRKSVDPIFRDFSDEGTLNFTRTVENACTRYKDSYGDFYSFCINFILGAGLESDRLTIGRFESLFEDLEGFLSGVGVEIGNGRIDRIRAMPSINRSAHSLYREYYGAELRELVGRSAETLIGRLGYEF